MVPAKRREQEDEEDEQEIMALLDEIDRINPLPSSSSCSAPVVATVAAATTTTTLFSLDVRGGTQKAAVALQAKDVVDDFLSSDLDPQEMTRPAILPVAERSLPATATVPYVAADQQPPILSTTEVLQFLPHPFFPETFCTADWMRNIAEFDRQEWRERVRVRDALSLKAGCKVPLLFVMIKEHYAHTRDAGVRIIDETGEMTATIQDRLLTLHKIRIHFGMTLLLRDATIFALHAEAENHLIVTLENVVHVFSNIHHL